MIKLILCVLSGFIIYDNSFVYTEKPMVETELYLSKDNTVVLWNIIDDNSVNQVIDDIMTKNSKDIYLVVNTNGGLVSATHRLKSFIEQTNFNVHTLSLNSISSGYVLTQLLGTRYVTKNSYLMMHEVSFIFSGKINYAILSELKREVFYQFNEIYKPLYTRIGMPEWKFRQAINPKLKIDYKKALKDNHADKLVTIKCSPDLIDYERIYYINAGVYSVKFPGCPITSKPLYINFLDGIPSQIDKGEIQRRFFPGSY